MNFIRIFETAMLLLFGAGNLICSFNSENPKIVWACGILGMLDFALAYILWL